jgi:hypothetical protein
VEFKCVGTCVHAIYGNRRIEICVKQRLGLREHQISDPQLVSEIDLLIGEWMNILKDEKADFHQSFRVLSEQLLSVESLDFNSIADNFINADRVRQWCVNYHELQQNLLSLSNSTWTEIQQKMLRVNPKYVLRNHLAQEVIAAAEQDDFSLCEAYLKVLTSPFDDHPELARFSKPPANQDKGIALSCSS